MSEHFDRLRETLRRRPRLEFRMNGYRPSAVLVPILVEPDGPPCLLLTERRADLRAHAGQVAFPGGRRDEQDIDLAATALRETAEELGIAPTHATVLGLLDDVPTPTGYMITPVVARISGPLTLRPSPDEVAAVLSPSLDELRRPESYRHGGSRSFLGTTYTMHEYLWDRWRIWGATARILHQLLELLDGTAGGSR